MENESEKLKDPKAEDDKKKEIKLATKTPIELNEKGMLLPKNADELMQVAIRLLKGGGIPKSYQTPEQVIAGWNFAAQLGLQPQLAIRCIAPIEGTMSMFGDLPLALCLSSGQLEEFDEFIIDKDYNKLSFENKNLNAEPFASVVLAKRKGKDRKSYAFTIEDAKTAGLWGKTSASGNKMPWAAYPKVMLIRRARAMMIKTDFADILCGAAIAEYDFNSAPDMRDVSETQDSGSSVLNAENEDA